MGKVLITEDYLEDIGDALREQLGGSETYTPGIMGDAIRSINNGLKIDGPYDSIEDLPVSGEENTVYLVVDEKGKPGALFNEYI